MLAPKAVKSNKGQIGSDQGPGGGSSSEFSEDDTPLMVRLNSQGTSRLNDTGKQRPRPFLSKKGAGFVIPRKKKQTNELLQVSNFNSRDGKELLRNVEQSYRDPIVGATFKFEKLELVHNDQLSREYQERKQCLRNECRNPRELEDKHAFLYTLDHDEAKRICEVGVEVGSTSISCLGDPSMGVYLCRHADVISRKPLPLTELGYLIVFKVVKGKVKPVTERTTTATTDLLEPTPNFDCHVSRSIQSLPANTPLSQVFEYSQYYFYEFAEEGDDLHLKRPRQCLPYAVITFSLGDSSTVHQELSIALDEMPSVENNGLVGSTTSILKQDTRILEKRRGRTSHVLWMGKIANKDRILADAQLVCHSLQKIKLPFDIGDKIVMKEKISFQQLRPFLTFPLFRAGPPSISKMCKASVAGDTSFFLHCDLLPVEDDHGKIEKLVKFFQEKSWAGIVKCPDANRVIFLIPTSQITLDLGITTLDSPAALHVLLFVKKQKTSKGNATSKTAAREKDSQEVKTVFQIQNELKRHFSDVVEIPGERRGLSLDSTRPKLTSTSGGNKITQDSFGSEYTKELTNEQTASWKNAVQDWLKRPRPLSKNQELQCTVTDSSVKKADKLPSSVADVPKTREPAALVPLNTSIQDEHARPSGSTEKQKSFPAKRVDDGASRQLKSDKRISKQDNIASVAPLAIKQVEHRVDPRLKRHSVDTEPSPDSHTAIMENYSMPYNAQEASLAQGVASTSVPTSSTIRPHVKYQVDDESLKTLLDKLQLPKRGDSGKGGYQINLDDGTRRALEILKQQEESKRRISDTQDRNVVAMDSKADGKLVVAVRKSDEKSVKKSNVSATQDKDKKTVTDRVGTVGENVPKPPAQKQAKKNSESRKEKRQKPAENLEKKRAKLSKEPEKHDALLEKPDKPVVQSAVPELSEDPFPAISSESLESLKSPPSKSNQASKAPKLKLILSKNRASAGLEVDNRESSDQKLTEQPEETNSLQDDRDKSMPDDAKIYRKSIESPVAMDISPQHTTPCTSGSVSPISVVSAKGRYNLGTASHPSHPSPVSSTFLFIPPLPQGPYRSPISSVVPPPPPHPPPPPPPPPHPMLFGPSSTPPSSASFSSLPGVHPISSMPSSAPMPFVSPSQAGPVFPPTSVIPLAPPATLVPPRMGPPATSVPPGMGPPTTSVPLGIRPPPGSPSFPMPPPPALPGNIQRKNSLDSIPNAASSLPGIFPSTFSGQQWTPALSQNQRFGFPPPHPGAVNMPPAVLPRPTLPPAIARPRLPGQPGDIHPPYRLGFVPIGAPRFPIPPGTSQGMPFVPPRGPHLLPPMVALTQLVNITGTPQMAPMPPMFGAPAQFMPHIPFQQPMGFWEAPLRPSAVPTSNVGRVPLHHPSGQKHLPVLSSTHKSPNTGKPHSKKDTKAKNDVGDERPQKSNMEQNKNSSDSGPKDDCSVDKLSTQLDKSKQPVLSMSDISEDDDPKSQKLKPAGSTEKKSIDKGMLKTEAVKELSIGSVKQPRDTEEARTRDLNKSQLGETRVQEPEKLTSESMLTPDSVCSKSKQNVDGTEEKLHGNDSTKDGKSLAMEDGADIKTRKTDSDAEPTSKTTVEESQTSSHTPEVPDDYISTTQNSEQIVQEKTFFPSSSVTGYLTEAEQTSTKAVSKIFDILRRNAQDSRSETDTTDQEPENPDEQDEPDKPDNPDCEAEAHVDEGVTKEEKLLFSGEESATSEQSTHLESGLRIVQLLDLGGSESEKDKEKSIKQLSVTVSGKQGEGDKPQEELLGESSEEFRNDGPQKKRYTSLSKNSRWEDISDESDEGTPERDLPGLVDIEFKQHWLKTEDTTHDTVTESTAAPVKPKTEVVCSEADSSTPTIKHYVTVPSQKRRRQISTTEGSDTEELTTPPKRRRPEARKRRRHRESPDKRSSVDNTKKTNRTRQRSEEKHQRSKKDHSREEKLPSRIVSDARGGVLKITISQDPHSKEEKRIKKEPELAETMEDEQLSEQKKPLAEIEYSDLEDISPGRLSSETERPATPDTPETATPAPDFTHPSLGFWAKPPVPVVAPVAMVTEELQASGADVLTPVTHLSYLDDQSHSGIQQSRVPYDMEEGSTQGDIAHAQASWPVKGGFFCQTTTSEERDLEWGVSDQSEISDKGVKEESYPIDDRYYSLPLQESEEDSSRYGQEFPQSEVFNYGHGQGDKQRNPHRSSGYTDSRNMHKGYKHHSATRESRYYPWKAHEEGTHNQMASTGGEGPKPSDQSATGKSTGSEKSRALDDDTNAVKRCKLDKGAHSTKHDTKSGEKMSPKKTSHIESIETDQPQKWEITVFAWMDKFQFSNWLRRKQHGAKLSSDVEDKKNSAQYTAESVRRSSERLFRRVKRQIRQSSRSCSKSPQLEDMQTSECPEFDFDDLDLESNLLKEESNSCVSNELSQDCAKDAADNVHSNEHPSPCTVDSEIVHRNVSFNVDDACKEADHIDQICDNEVSVLLESGEIDEQPTGRVLDEENNDAADARTEQIFGQLSKDQATECKELDVKRRSLTSDAEVGIIHGRDTELEGSMTKLFDPVLDEGQPCVDLGNQEHNKTGPGRIIDCKIVDGGKDEQHPVACSYSLNDVEVTGGVTLSLNSQHDQDAKETQKEVKGVERSGEQSLEVACKDTVTENVQETAQSSCEGVIVNTEGNDSQGGNNSLDDKDVCLSGKLGEKEADQESSSCDPVSAVVTEEAIGDIDASGFSRHQNNMQLELNKQCLAVGDSDKAHITTQAVDDKACETNSTCTNRSPFVVTSVMSSDQLSKYLLTANVATSEDPRVHDVWPHSTSPTLPTTPLSASITTHYPVLSSPPPNFMWPGIGHAGPFPTAGMVPALPMQQPSYGFPSWVDHAPHVPFPVACVKPPAASDGICPPGTENEQTSKASGLGDVGENTDNSLPHGSVMDHSTVTALMQFYSEISEVEGSDNADNKKINENTETKTDGSVQKPLEVAEIREHGATSELEMESDLEGSMVDVTEDMDVPEIKGSDKPIPESIECFDGPNEEEQKMSEVESTEISNKQSTSAEGVLCSTMDVTPVEDSVVEKPVMSSTLSSSVGVMPIDNTGVSSLMGLTVNTALSVDVTPLTNPGIGIEAMQVENIDIPSPLSSTVGTPLVESPSIPSREAPEEVPALSPIDPAFFANAEQTIFSSIGDLKNLLGQSSTFDRIAEDAIASTVSSLEDVLRQAQNSYLEPSSCPSDSGLSTGEEVSIPSKSSSILVPMSPLQVSSNLRTGCRAEGNETSHCISKVAEKQSLQKKPQKSRKKFHFFVYSPEHDRECEAVKNYMLKGGGIFVDIKDSACLDETSRELKVLIRRKHLPSVHRLANLYHLKMVPFVKFSLFSTLADVIEGSRLYESIFVSGGALLADDIILKTIEIEHLDGLLRYLKEQSLAHQKFVWVLNISRNGYKKLSVNRPLTKRDSKVLNLLRRYRDEGFITVLPKGYVTGGIPATQRYLQTSLKLQIELISVYRHIILLSDMDKSRVEVPWFLQRGIGVMNIQEFLTTFAGESEAKNLLVKRPQVSCYPEATTKESCTVLECYTPEDDIACPTPEGTPVSDSSTDSPITNYGESGVKEQLQSATTAAPQKRAARSLSWDTSNMTQTRLQILSCVRSVRDDIRNQISSSSPSSPVSRSM